MPGGAGVRCTLHGGEYPWRDGILDLIGEGKTNRQIAESMYLAEKTVKNYVSNLLTKLGMARRTEAAAYIARVGERHRHRYDEREG